MGPDNSSRVGQTANSFSARRASHEKGWAENISRFAVNATVGLFETEEGRKKFEPFHDASRIFDQIGSNIHGVLNGDQREIADEREVALRRDQSERARKDEEDARERQQANLQSRNSTGVRGGEEGDRRGFLQSRVDQQERTLYNTDFRRPGSVASEISPRAYGEVGDLMRSNHRGQRGFSDYLTPDESQNQRPYPAGNLASTNRQGNHMTDEDAELARKLQQQLLDEQQQLREQSLKVERQLKELNSPRQDPSKPRSNLFEAYTSLGSGSGLVLRSNNFKSDINNSFAVVGRKIKDMENTNDEKGLNIVTIKKTVGSKGFMVDNKEINEMIIGHDVTEKNRKEMVYFSPASRDSYERQENELYEAIRGKITNSLTRNDQGMGFSNNDLEFELQLNYLFKDIKTISDAKKTDIYSKTEITGHAQQDIQINKFFKNTDPNSKLQDLDGDKDNLIRTFAKQIAKDGFKNNIDLDWKESDASDGKSKISHISVSRPNQDGGSKRIDIKASGIFDDGMHHVSVPLENNIYAKFNFIDDGNGKYALDNHIKYLEPNKKDGNLEEITDPAKLIKAKKLIKGYKIDITTNAEEESRRYTQIRQNNTLPSYRLGYGARDPKIESRKKVESSQLFQFETKDGIKCFTFGETDPLTGNIGKKFSQQGVDVKIVKNQEKFELKFGDNNGIYTKEHGWLYDRSINAVIDDTAKGGKRDVDLERKSQYSWGVTKTFGNRLWGKKPDDHMVIRAYDKDDKKYYEFEIKKIQNPLFGLSRYDLKCTSISDSPKTLGHQSGGGVDMGR